MASFNITCGGPGPHVPASGILGVSDQAPTADVRCSSSSCVKPVDPVVTNQATLQQQAQTALVNNRTFLALATPTATMTLAQQQQLWNQQRATTQQCQALIRLALQQFDATN